MNYANNTNITQRYSNVDALSVEGRLGRKRYFVYSVVLPLLIFWAITTIASLTSYLPVIGTASFYAIVGAALAASAFMIVCLTIQRCHDFNKSGFWAILALIPFTTIIFALIPGTNGLNSYGEIPVPESNIFKTLFYVLLVVLAALLIYAVITLLIGQSL